MSGWDCFFDNKFVDIIASVLLFLFISDIAIKDNSIGFAPIMNTSHNGRNKTFIAKLIVCMIIAAFFVLLFSLTALAVCAVINGLSSPFAAIQSIKQFILYPYNHAIWQYFIIFLAFKTLAYIAFTTVIYFIALITNNEPFSFAASGIVYVILTIINALQSFGRNFIVSAIDFISISNVTPLFTRYRAANLFGYPHSYILCIAAILITVTIIMIICCYTAKRLQYGNQHMNVLPRHIFKMPHLFSFASRKKNIGKYSLKLISYELYKQRMLLKYIAVIVLLLKAALSIWYFTPEDSLTIIRIRRMQRKLKAN